MLNIEVIRFEAQDVITASVAAPVVPAHTHHWKWDGSQLVSGQTWIQCQEPGCTNGFTFTGSIMFDHTWN